MAKNSLLDEAQQYCEKTGARLTEPRRNVLAIIAKSGKPLGAYDIIEKMPAGTQPPTVYRALDFWEKQGFLHRISSLNVYTACKAGHRHSGAQFLICNECGTISESHICHMPNEFSDEAKKQNFDLDGWFLELRGICGACRKNEPPSHNTALC